MAFVSVVGLASTGGAMFPLLVALLCIQPLVTSAIDLVSDRASSNPTCAGVPAVTKGPTVRRDG